MSGGTDALLDKYLAERDLRVATQAELDRTAEELGAYKLAHAGYQQHVLRCSRYFGWGWLVGIGTAVVVGAVANTIYTAYIQGTP